MRASRLSQLARVPPGSHGSMHSTERRSQWTPSTSHSPQSVTAILLKGLWSRRRLQHDPTEVDVLLRTRCFEIPKPCTRSEPSHAASMITEWSEHDPRTVADAVGAASGALNSDCTDTNHGPRRPCDP